MDINANNRIGNTGYANRHDYAHNPGRNAHGGFSANGRFMRNPSAKGTLGAFAAAGGPINASGGQTALKGGLSGVEPEPATKKTVFGKTGQTRGVTTHGFNFQSLGIQRYEDGSYALSGPPVSFKIKIDGRDGLITLTPEDIMRVFEESSEYRKAFDIGDGSYDNEVLKEMAVSRFMKGDVSGPNGEDSAFYVKKDGKLVKVDQAFIDKLVGHEFSQYNAADRKAVKTFFDGAELHTDKAKAVDDLAAKTPADKKYYVYNKDTEGYDEINKDFVDALAANGVDIKQYLAGKTIYEENPLRIDATREFAKLISSQIEAQFGEEYKNVATATGNGEITFRKTGSQISISGQEGFETLEDANPAADANAELIDEMLTRWQNKEKDYYAQFMLIQTTMSKLQTQQGSLAGDEK